MKKIIYLLFIVQAIFFTSGCKKDLESEGVSKLSIEILLKGNSLMTIPKGTAFVEPGYTAIDGNTQANVTSNIKISGTVDSNNTGLYEITYSIVNSEGISSTATRQVVIYDPAAPPTDISGSYLSNVNRVSPARSFKNLSVIIKKLAPGFFYVSDFLGGFYDQGYAYGSSYAMTGYMQLNADNTLTLVSSYVDGWHDSLNSFTNGMYNSATNTISWDANYTSSNWDYLVTLTLVQ